MEVADNKEAEDTGWLGLGHEGGILEPDGVVDGVSEPWLRLLTELMDSLRSLE